MEAVLKKDKRFVSNEGELQKNTIIEAGLKLDSRLLELLAKNEKTKKAFFKKAEDILVFDKIEFQRFIGGKYFLPDSYTIFKNKVGLSDGGNGYLKQKNDVVLNWAYKDCVLEGGMTKEEKGKNEIFYNTILAHDEITRLYAPKVFTGFEKWDAEAVKKGKAKPVTEIKTADNFLINGNNLLALHCLKKRYASKVKLIYIDPPYNTETNAFLYNNTFNHSTWLTFMKNRLEVAKSFLREDGIISIDIDHYELFYLGALCDEIFGVENRLGVVAVEHKPGGRQFASHFAVSHENKLVYAANKEKVGFYGLPVGAENIKRYTKKDELGKFKLRSLVRTGDASTKKESPTLWFPLYVNVKTKEISVDEMKKDCWIKVLPIDSRGVERCWRWGKEKIKEKWKTELVISGNKKNLQIYSKDRPSLTGRKKPTTMWVESRYAGTAGTSAIKGIFGDKVFTYPKSPYQVSDILELATKEGDLVLDFFGGSGTTFDVAHKMKRRWIGIEQMDYVQNVTKERLKKVIEGDQTGISEEVNWKGGGEFIYCELKEWNEKYIQDILKAKTKTDIARVYSAMKSEAFFQYDVDLTKYEGEDFAGLSLEYQKKALCDCLNANHLYINYSEIDDTQYRVSDEEKRLTKEMYGE